MKQKNKKRHSRVERKNDPNKMFSTKKMSWINGPVFRNVHTPTKANSGNNSSNMSTKSCIDLACIMMPSAYLILRYFFHRANLKIMIFLFLPFSDCIFQACVQKKTIDNITCLTPLDIKDLPTRNASLLAPTQISYRILLLETMMSNENGT